jgi:hypothetical protein
MPEASNYELGEWGVMTLAISIAWLLFWTGLGWYLDKRRHVNLPAMYFWFGAIAISGAIWILR